MGETQIDRQCHDVEAERRARFQPLGQRRQRGAAATLAVTGILLDTRHHRLDLRQINLVVASGKPVIVLVECGLAVGAAHRTRDHCLVGVLRQQSSAALPPQTALARAFTFGLVGAVGLLSVRGRHRKVVRRLRWLTELGLEFVYPSRQRLDLRPERTDQRILLVVRQAGEVGRLGHPKLESWATSSRQSSFDSAAYITSSGGDE